MLKLLSLLATERVSIFISAAASVSSYFDVSPGRADLVGTGEFIKAELKGENKDRGLSRAELTLTRRSP